MGELVMLSTLWYTMLIAVGSGGGMFGFIWNSVLYWRCLRLPGNAANLINLCGSVLFNFFSLFEGLFFIDFGLTYELYGPVKVSCYVK